MLAGTRAPVRMWTDPSTVEDAALQQLRNVADLPWTHGVAVMPDVHFGKGATVGSVIAMREAVSPAAVGVDIGCGMSAVRTSLTAADLPDSLARVRAQIEKDVPVGRDLHQQGADLRRVGLDRAIDWSGFWARFDELNALTRDIRWTTADKLRKRAHQQIGTLGGGNHFIEVCLDEDERVWLMLHSGSRNIGNVLAELHIETAQGLAHNKDLPDRDLAVFLAHTPQMDAYRADLYWAQEYARLNRTVMMGLVKAAFGKAMGRPVGYDDEISCFAGETEVLTRNGVRPIRDLAGGWHELLTTGGKWVKAPVESFGEQRIYEVVVGRYGQEKIIRTTGGHRWLLRPKVAHNRTEATTVELRIGDRLDYAFAQRPEGHDEHRCRWAANREAVERRGWTVRAVRETNTVEEVFCAVVDGTHAFTLADNILTGNCHHNYVAEETYDDLDLIVTRKGAISTAEGRLGIIPGSMGTGSYIVRGLANESAFCSASHGAGRKMSRNAARRTFTVADLQAQTEGVECRKDAGVLDEIPGSYKDLETVMAQQTDLVDVVHRLRTIVCVKG